MVKFEDDYIDETYTTEEPQAFAKPLASSEPIKKKIDKVNSSVSKLNAAIDLNDTSCMAEKINQALLDLNSLYKEVSLVGSNLDLDPSLGDPTIIVHANISFDNESIAIEFDSLPAKRGKLIKDRSHFNIFAFQNALDEAVSSYINRGEKILQFREQKVLVSYCFCVNEKEQFLDYDNYDVKGLTDWLTLHFLADDNPDCICQFFESKKVADNSSLKIEITPYR